jgi:alpha-L-fucosidase
MTINHTWGYKSDDENWKSTKVLLQNLIDIASKGGNYLLNVGPTGEGLIPQASVERLEEIGKWMDANGESIYVSPGVAWATS